MSLPQWPASAPKLAFFAVDEARFGLKVWHRRRWCPVGHRPPWQVEDRYEWTWLYAAVEPSTGESFSLYMPHLDGACFEVFLQKLREAYPDEEIVLILDRAGAHRNKSVAWPAGIEAMPLPAYSPELKDALRLVMNVHRPLSWETPERASPFSKLSVPVESCPSLQSLLAPGILSVGVPEIGVEGIQDKALVEVYLPALAPARKVEAVVPAAVFVLTS